MKALRIFSAAAAALLLLAGCTHELKTARVSDEGNQPLMEGSEVGMSYSYDVEYVTGGVSDDVKDKINNYIIRNNIFYDEEETGTDMPEACARWAQNCVEGYQSDIEDFLSDYDEESSWMFNWSSDISGSFEASCPSRNLVSYCMSSADYTGGAHGMYGETYTVFDLKTGEVVTEQDLLVDDCEEDLAVLLGESLYDSLDEEDYDAIYEEPTPNGNFYVDETGVTWVFNPYEIAPYAMGPIQVCVTWNNLKPYLRK